MQAGLAQDPIVDLSGVGLLCCIVARQTQMGPLKVFDSILGANRPQRQGHVE